jgi:hypothetical protein
MGACKSSSDILDARSKKDLDPNFYPFVDRVFYQHDDADERPSFTLCHWNLLHQVLTAPFLECRPEDLEWEYRFMLIK